MAYKTFADGEVLYDDDLNQALQPCKIITIDESSDLTIVGVGANTPHSHDKSYVIAAASLTTMSYLSIKLLGEFKAHGGGSTGAGRIALKIEATAPDAVTYFDNTICEVDPTLGDSDSDTDNSFEYIRTLTANEQAMGLTIKITLTATTDSGLGQYTNRQIVFTAFG